MAAAPIDIPAVLRQEELRGLRELESLREESIGIFSTLRIGLSATNTQSAVNGFWVELPPLEERGLMVSEMVPQLIKLLAKIE